MAEERQGWDVTVKGALCCNVISLPHGAFFSLNMFPKFRCWRLNPQIQILMILRDGTLEKKIRIRWEYERGAPVMMLVTFIRGGREPWGSTLGPSHHMMLSVMSGCSRKALTRCWYQDFGFPGHQNHDPNKPPLFIIACLIYVVIAQKGH